MSEHTTTDQTPAPRIPSNARPSCVTGCLLAARRGAYACAEGCTLDAAEPTHVPAHAADAATRAERDDPAPWAAALAEAEADQRAATKPTPAEPRAWSDVAPPLSAAGVFAAARMLADRYGMPVVTHSGRPLADHLADHLAGSAVTTDRLSVPADAARHAYAYLTADDALPDPADPLDVPDPATLTRLLLHSPPGHPGMPVVIGFDPARTADEARSESELIPDPPYTRPQDEPAGRPSGDRSVDEQRPGRTARANTPHAAPWPYGTTDTYDAMAAALDDAHVTITAAVGMLREHNPRDVVAFGLADLAKRIDRARPAETCADDVLEEAAERLADAAAADALRDLAAELAGDEPDPYAGPCDVPEPANGPCVITRLYVAVQDPDNPLATRLTYPAGEAPIGPFPTYDAANAYADRVTSEAPGIVTTTGWDITDLTLPDEPEPEPTLPGLLDTLLADPAEALAFAAAMMPASVVAAALPWLDVLLDVLAPPADEPDQTHDEPGEGDYDDPTDGIDWADLLRDALADVCDALDTPVTLDRALDVAADRIDGWDEARKPMMEAAEAEEAALARAKRDAAALADVLDAVLNGRAEDRPSNVAEARSVLAAYRATPAPEPADEPQLAADDPLDNHLADAADALVTLLYRVPAADHVDVALAAADVRTLLHRREARP